MDLAIQIIGGVFKLTFMIIKFMIQLFMMLIRAIMSLGK
jgi:hypothetical protein